MSASPRFVIDIGSSKIAGLAVERTDEGRTRVLAGSFVPSQGVSRGAVTDTDEAAKAVSTAVAELEAKTSVAARELSVSVGGSHLRCTESRGVMPIYPAGRVLRAEDAMAVVQHSRQAILPPGREQLHASPRWFRVDGGEPVAEILGLKCARLEVATLLVTAESKVLERTENAVRIGGRSVAEVAPVPLASALGCVPSSAIEQGCIVVDLGAGTTSVAVFCEGCIGYVGCLPVGSEHVTSDIATLLKLDRDEAERLKLEHGVATAASVGSREAIQVHQPGTSDSRPVQRRVLCEVIESRLREIAQLVCQIMGPTRSPGSLPGGLWLTGAGSQLPGLGELFEEEIGIAQPGTGGRAAGKDGRPSPAMSVVIGLAKYALAGDETELAPVSGAHGWRDKVRSLRALLQPT